MSTIYHVYKRILQSLIIFIYTSDCNHGNTGNCVSSVCSKQFIRRCLINGRSNLMESGRIPQAKAELTAIACTPQSCTNSCRGLVPTTIFTCSPNI